MGGTYIRRYLLENQLKSKNHSKFIFCCAPLLFVFFPAGLLLTEGEILSSASYVWRRGKPSTWLPGQKLAFGEDVKNPDFFSGLGFFFQDLGFSGKKNKKKKKKKKKK